MKYNDRIGHICVVKANHKPTPNGVFHPLPAGLSDGQFIRLLPGWKAMEDGHTVVWSVQPIDARGVDSGPAVAGVWERHFRLVKPNGGHTEPATRTANAAPPKRSATEESPRPVSTMPPFQNAQEYLERLRALAGLPERNVEDAVKDLLLYLGHERGRILFQIGRIDVAVQDHTGRTAMVIEVKRSLGSAPQRDDALRKGFDYAGRNGARYVVVTDADRFEIYDRTRGLDHASMLCAKFRLTDFRDSDAAALDLLRPQTSA